MPHLPQESDILFLCVHRLSEKCFRDYAVGGRRRRLFPPDLITPARVCRALYDDATNPVLASDGEPNRFPPPLRRPHEQQQIELQRSKEGKKKEKEKKGLPSHNAKNSYMYK